MPHTDKLTVLAKEIETRIKAVSSNLGIKDVLYGNHTQIPYSPSVVVLTDDKVRSLAGVSAPGGRTENTLTVFIDVHSSKVGDESASRLALEQLAESVETELHKDVTMGGIIIHGYVRRSSNGETTLQNGEFRTVRMTYVGVTKTYLSPSP